MMRRFTLCMIACLLFSLQSLFAQIQQTPGAEKVYVQYDRPYYTAGQTIWFKAYLYNSRFPSQLSSEIYLQVEDEGGKIIERSKYPVNGATVAGNILLDESLPGGYYTIKIITDKSAPDNASFFYSKNIFVYNAQERQKDTLLQKQISLQFFPESGHLIDRIKTQVAFKAIDERGNPVNVEGVIKTDSSGVIANFKSFHDGIGKVSFTPHISEPLFAELNINGKTLKYPLPKIESSGLYMKISDAEGGKSFELTRSKNNSDFFDTVRLVVKMNNDTVFETVIPFENNQSMVGMLKTEGIPSGIMHFIVLTKANIPLAERLTFVNNKEYISAPQLITIKRDSTKRGFNSYELKFPDTLDRTYAIAVSDAWAQDFPDKENIYSRLLLTSDLKGYVYNPGYYFEKDNAETKQALDNLMLTHGWTRYTWRKEPVTITNTNHYLLKFSGLVTDQRNGQPVTKGALGLQVISEDSTFQFYDAVVDNSGRFSLDSLIFYGNAKIYYSYANSNGKSVAVNIKPDEDKSDEIYKLLSSRGVEESQIEKLDTSFYGRIPSPQLFEGKYKQLSTVFVKTKVKRPEEKINEKYASVLFRGSGKIIRDNINEPYNDKSQSVIDFVLNNIRTIAFDRDAGTLVNQKNFSLQSGKNWKVEVMLDEIAVPVTSARSITMDHVALIKFFEAGFVGVSSEAPGGAVAIYMKKIDDNKNPVTPGNEKFISYKGYAVTQEFYKPDYEHVSREHSAPDNRMTLYWEPVVDKGARRFSFYNNDISKKLNISIEGVDVSGKLIRYELQEE